MRHSFIFIFIATLAGCVLMPPRRQYLKEVKNQQIPQHILNTTWILESFDNNPPDCPIAVTFLEKGQFTFKFKDQLYNHDNLYYIVKGSSIEFHTRPLEKLAWITDDCKMNPSSFALYIHGLKEVIIENDILKFEWIGKELRFRKV